MTAAYAALAFCLALAALHLLSAALTATRMGTRRPPLAPPTGAPYVSIVRPLCGIEEFSAETLAASFTLNYPRYEVLFCVARGDDPVTAIVHRLIEAHPHVAARLLVGDDRVSLNPKLNNCVKGWAAARHDFVVMADSNVLMPRDYVQRMLARWQRDTGVVCSVPIGSRPTNFWAELECAFLNTYQARWQYAADTLGFGFAQGKSMLTRKSLIDPRGGIAALGAEIAEDAALTKLLHDAGKKVHLVDDPFEQPLGRRTMREVWSRQRRWSRLRRVTFPLQFLPELAAGSVAPTLAALAFAAGAHLSPLAVAVPLLVVWFGAEAAVARHAGWHWSPRMIAAAMLRDLLLPLLWVDSWLGSDFVWRGTPMRPGDEIEESA